MIINILRGQNQIGGSIIEVATKTTKIILDLGSELGEEIPVPPDIEGLFYGERKYDAIVITHYHGDHIGLAEYALPQIPVFMGEKAYKIYKAAAEYTDKNPISVFGYLRGGEKFDIGDISITPFLCDHSAFDSYMLLIEHGGQKVLYTGDFRANGRKSYSALLRRLDTVDALITEGTTLLRVDTDLKTETDLEQIAADRITETDAPVFAVMAATNIDRIVTLYKAARKTRRLFLQDVYMALIAEAAGETIPNPVNFGGLRVFLTLPTEKNRKILKRYGIKAIKRDTIAEKRFIMCVRPSMRNYLSILSDKISFEGGILFYSMWSGYMENDDMAQFLAFMKEKGVTVIPLHTSGHADTKAIDALVAKTKPRYIIPVHTENAKWFERYENTVVVHDKSLEI